MFQAHAPFSLIHNLNIEDANESRNKKFYKQLYLFTSRLTGEPIGLTALQMFVTDKATILTVRIKILSLIFTKLNIPQGTV